MTRKAVVLARGLGTRMQRASSEVELGGEIDQLAARGLKVLIPVHGRPFLDYIVDSLRQAGVRRVCLIVAPGAEEMRRHAERISRLSGVAVECAVQQEPRGTADAVLAAEEFAAGEPFVLTNGDNLFAPAAIRPLARLEGDDCAVVAFPRDALLRHGVISADRVKGFAVVVVSDGGELLGLVEKPANPDRYAVGGQVLVSMNLYRFGPAVFGHCRAVEPDPDRGELELTAAVTALIRSKGTPFHVIRREEPVLDLTSRTDIAQVAAALESRRPSF